MFSNHGIKHSRAQPSHEIASNTHRIHLRTGLHKGIPHLNCPCSLKITLDQKLEDSNAKLS